MDVAQHMGEADLMRLGQVLLAGVAVGDPDAGPMTAQHVPGDRFSPRGRDLVQHCLGRDEHPLPVGGAVDAGGRFVGRDHAGRRERLLDRRAFGGHRRFGATKSVGDRTLFLRESKGESVSIVSEEDRGKGVLNHYSPAQPLVIAGMNAGDEKTMRI